MRPILLLMLLAALVQSCIGDDIIQDTVTEELRITSTIDTLAVNDTYQFEGRYTNNIGQTQALPVFWSTTDASILSIDDNGLATGIATGAATVYAEVVTPEQLTLRDSVLVAVGTETVTTISERTGVIRTTSSYVLEGDFIVTQEGDELIIEVADNYRASASLPGLYLYLTNNPNTTNNAFEVGKVDVFNGGHTYRINGINISEYDYLLYYCKPFSVKVGDGQLSE
ncbi:MAG: hypothetical protein AAF798_18035 [Bacteroidota bacterium]